MVAAFNACRRLWMLWGISYLGRRSVLGRHGIGIDPYHLTHRVEEAGYHPKVIWRRGSHYNSRMR